MWYEEGDRLVTRCVEFTARQGRRRMRIKELSEKKWRGTTGLSSGVRTRQGNIRPGSSD